MCGRPWSGPEAVRGRSVNVRPRTKTCVGVPRAAQLGQVGFGGMGCKVGGQVPVATDPAHSSHPRHPSGLARGFRGHARGIPISGWRSRMPCSVPRRSVGRPRAERTVRSPLPRSDQFLHVRIGEPVRGSDVFELGAEGFARLDLGEEWKKRQGLPFVYAVMVRNPRTTTEGLAARIGEAKKRGLEAASTIARSYNSGVDAGRAEHYLRHVIRYDLGEREKLGLALFHRLAQAKGLLARVKELEFDAI